MLQRRFRRQKMITCIEDVLETNKIFIGKEYVSASKKP